MIIFQIIKIVHYNNIHRCERNEQIKTTITEMEDNKINFCP